MTGGITQGSAAAQRSDHAGAGHRARERADAADHHSHETLDQKAKAEIGEQREHRHDQRAGKTGQRGAERKRRAVDRIGRNPRCAGQRGFSSEARIRKPNAVWASSR